MRVVVHPSRPVHAAYHPASIQRSLEIVSRQFALRARLKLAGKQPAEIRKTLDKRYEQVARSVEQLKSEDVFSLFLNSYTASIDPHTDYLNPRSAENTAMALQTSLDLRDNGGQRPDDN